MSLSLSPAKETGAQTHRPAKGRLAGTHQGSGLQLSNPES